MTATIASLLVASAILVGVRTFARPSPNTARARLDQFATAAGVPPDEPQGVMARTMLPMARAAMQGLAALLPEHLGAWLHEEIEAAGLQIRPATMVTVTLAGGAGFTGLTLMTVLDAPSTSPPLRLLLVLLAGGTSLVGPITWVRGRATRRQQAIQRALPDTLDLIVVSVEASLGLEAAFARITEQRDDPLALELRHVLADINLGIARREALQAMSRRARSPGVSSLVTAVLQAERTGMGIAQVLRTQATHLRTIRRQHAEEAAMKAPLKMLFPLIFFIFPSLFVVVLGPAVLNLTESMRGN